jgi:hypothetical protein
VNPLPTGPFTLVFWEKESGRCSLLIPKGSQKMPQLCPGAHGMFQPGANVSTNSTTFVQLCAKTLSVPNNSDALLLFTGDCTAAAVSSGARFQAFYNNNNGTTLQTVNDLQVVGFPAADTLASRRVSLMHLFPGVPPGPAGGATPNAVTFQILYAAPAGIQITISNFTFFVLLLDPAAIGVPPTAKKP